MTAVYSHVLDKLAASAASSTDRIDWDSDTIKMVAVDSGYTFSAAHTNLGQVSAGARIYTVTLATALVSPGKMDATDPAAQTPAAGDTIIAYIIYKEGASESASWLISYHDTFATGQPIDIDTSGAAIITNFHTDGLVVLRTT
jgi:hypothetical protein